jgi:hypothetical protein
MMSANEIAVMIACLIPLALGLAALIWALGRLPH